MKTLTVEFTGTPEAGKTTCINKIIEHFEKSGYKVGFVQESAEITPKNFSKGCFDQHLWMRLHSLENILVEKHSECDILLIDRGVIDGIFYTYLFLSRNPEDEEKCSALIQFLHRLDFLLPNFLLVFTSDPEVSIKRRGGEGRLVTIDYIKKYNQLLSSFLPEINVPYTLIDSSNLTEDEVFTIVLKEIQNLIKSNLS